MMAHEFYDQLEGFILSFFLPAVVAADLDRWTLCNSSLFLFFL